MIKCPVETGISSITNSLKKSASPFGKADFYFPSSINVSTSITISSLGTSVLPL